MIHPPTRIFVLVCSTPLFRFFSGQLSRVYSRIYPALSSAELRRFFIVVNHLPCFSGGVWPLFAVELCSCCRRNCGYTPLLLADVETRTTKKATKTKSKPENDELRAGPSKKDVFHRNRVKDTSRFSTLYIYTWSHGRGEHINEEILWRASCCSKEILAFFVNLREALFHPDCLPIVKSIYYVFRPHVGQHAEWSDAERLDMIACIWRGYVCMSRFFC